VGVGPVAVGVGVTVGRTAVRVAVGGTGVRVDVGALRAGVRVGHGFRVWVGEGVCVGVVVSVSVGVVVSVSVDVGVSSVGVGVAVISSASASGVGVSVGARSSSIWSIPGWLLEAADGEIGLISIWSSACTSPSPSGGISQSSSKKMLARSSNEGIRAEQAVPSRDRSINANSTQARATLDRDRPFGPWPRNERKRLMPLFLGERNEIDIAVAGSNCLTQPSMLPAEPLQFSYAICPQYEFHMQNARRTDIFILFLAEC
jgi:hypothetical protein